MNTSRRLLMLLILWLSWGAIAHAATVTYVYTDPQGTPLAEADASGNITATFDYRPYGTQALGTAPSGPGYTGHVNDPETDLVYMQARYYDPNSGRFLSMDPIGVSPGNGFNFSRYDYANNNPIANIDPDGRQSTMDAGWWVGQATMSQQSPQQFQQLNEQNAAQAQVVLTSIATMAAAPAVGFVARTAVAVAADSLASGSLAAGLMANGEAVTASGALLVEGAAVANGVVSPFSSEALVVRGGDAANQSAAKIQGAIGPSRTPGVIGFSCQCDGGTDLSELGSFLRNNQVGVTTVGDIRAAGGEVVVTPGYGHHVTVTNLSGEQASPLMKIQKNPNPLITKGK
ncbi:RHS repeat-associated core domain-containing protein [Dyella silvatica]|uniref:RHS repeat-associated core domain-containing protein n=1 Tax=Dyella silvatica TaxID=2992128 RepID=UPI00225448BA|nr:RHS repeat-associated core domain-containing protein [Dyella silvatica]